MEACEEMLSYILGKSKIEKEIKKKGVKESLGQSHSVQGALTLREKQKRQGRSFMLVGCKNWQFFDFTCLYFPAMLSLCGKCTIVCFHMFFSPFLLCN